MEPEDILIRYAYSEYTKPILDSDQDDYINGELTYKSVPYTNEQTINGDVYKITLHECIYKLDSETVSKKSTSVGNYLSHYDEVGPIRGWIHLNTDSKYKQQQGRLVLNQNNCTNNVITTFGEDRYSQAFIFTKYKEIVEQCKAENENQRIETINPTLTTNITHKPNVLQIGRFGSLMTGDKINTCEVNFIGKITFPVFELRIFDVFDRPIKDQMIYDLYIKDFYTDDKRSREQDSEQKAKKRKVYGKNKKKRRTRTKPKKQTTKKKPKPKKQRTRTK